jgi:hypothetical protein
VLLICIRSYLKSVLRYKFLILDTCYPDTIYIYIYLYKSEKGCEDAWLFFEAERSQRAKRSGNTDLKVSLWNRIGWPCYSSCWHQFIYRKSKNFRVCCLSQCAALPSHVGYVYIQPDRSFLRALIYCCNNRCDCIGEAKINSINFRLGFEIWIACDFPDVAAKWIKINLPKSANKTNQWKE